MDILSLNVIVLNKKLDLRQNLSMNLNINGIKNQNIKSYLESLKLTASENNLYSLSSPQLKNSINIFCMYKDLSGYKWINNDENVKLNPKDYEIFINPHIKYQSKIQHYEYESCSSFKL
jgi:peptide deformylase